MITGSLPRLKLLVVTKGKSVDQILELLRENPALFRIGENRIEEAEMKFEALRKGLGQDFNRLEKHFLGKLQSRKIRKVVELFEVVQSVEDLSQAKKLSEAALALGKNLIVFVEVNLSGLSQRSGVAPEKAADLLSAIQKLPGLRLEGVMGMASPDLIQAREQFRLLKTLQGDLSECSMGMSGDHRVAIEEGSTMLRLGRLLFEQGLPSNIVFE